MKLWTSALLVLLLAACARQAPAPMVDRLDDYNGFKVRHPQGWIGYREDDTLWLVPRGTNRVPPDVAEFILIVSRPATGKLDDTTIRRAVFELLPIHGVSGFQQDARTTDQVLWYKFEVTGSSGGEEWASVGVVAAGDSRYHIVVCAKPLQKWRDGQKQCDEVVKTFQPGNLQ